MRIEFQTWIAKLCTQRIGHVPAGDGGSRRPRVVFLPNRCSSARALLNHSECVEFSAGIWDIDPREGFSSTLHPPGFQSPEQIEPVHRRTARIERPGIHWLVPLVLVSWSTKEDNRAIASSPPTDPLCPATCFHLRISCGVHLKKLSCAQRR